VFRFRIFIIPSHRLVKGLLIEANGASLSANYLMKSKGTTLPKLSGKTVVITGATSGMALATAKLFVQEGAYVFITGRRQDALDAAVKEIGTNVTGVQGDVANISDLDRLYETVKSERGHLDAVFASAGKGQSGKPLGTITEEDVHDLLSVNVRGTLFTVQKALPLFRNGGSIILNSSIAHMKGLPGASVYSATKAAVRAFARGWTMELKDRNIRVNAISPGPIDTALFSGAPQEVREWFKAWPPMGRFGHAEEIAKAALFLASDDSSFITGIDLCVDGGAAQV
jgi:NAD(P)-dependent dehydrogenase (short-subunit alcohol dehydrogenase family)